MLKVFIASILMLPAFSYNLSLAQEIKIETRNTCLTFDVGTNKKLYQTYLGAGTTGVTTLQNQTIKHEAYIPSGTDNLFEPAIRMVHADGNPSLELLYVKHQITVKDSDVTLTTITLNDPQYPVTLTLNLLAYFNEDVIETWTELRHLESKPVILTNYASSMLHLDANQYWLTQFHALNPGREATMEESCLSTGIKIIDSKLGTRAAMYNTPGFYLSLDKESDENTGEVIAGTLAWTGNFQLLFEMDNTKSLRVISGINPFGAAYHLEKNKAFVTPPFIFTYSNTGRGQASRNLQHWGRKYGVLDGEKPRMTLLNNWETTTFNFDERKIQGLLTDTKTLGAELFLLDDGWFGNKYPRINDKAGLGDWQVNKTRFPNGLAPLLKSAEDKNIKFGLWIEPEMVNPKSELYEKHPDWILKLPNRAEDYQRNQLVLDLANPKVQDFIYETLDKLLTDNPGIKYLKWDCNRRMTNAYSPYLKAQQSHLQIEYNLGLYHILDRFRNKYPHLPMMLCSAGGGRTDYGALKYFNEFWPSDDTDPFERVYIQWGYSYFFPVITSVNHVTSMGKQPIKFRTDVAMMGKLGYDININKLSADELKFSRDALILYRRVAEVIWQGNMYRLISPYQENRAVLMYVNPDKNKAILFAYNMNVRYRETFNKVKLNGLDPTKNYKVSEINLMPGTVSKFMDDNKLYSGDQLMKVGLTVSSGMALTSAIFEIVEQ